MYFEYEKGKWQEYTRQALYKVPELKFYAPLAENINWERYYNDATLLSISDPSSAGKRLRKIIANCHYNWRVGSAYYHLYKIEEKVTYLENCVKLYPSHTRALTDLEQLQRQEKAQPEK